MIESLFGRESSTHTALQQRCVCASQYRILAGRINRPSMGLGVSYTFFVYEQFKACSSRYLKVCIDPILVRPIGPHQNLRVLPNRGTARALLLKLVMAYSSVACRIVSKNSCSSSHARHIMADWYQVQLVNSSLCGFPCKRNAACALDK